MRETIILLVLLAIALFRALHPPAGCVESCAKLGYQPTRFISDSTCTCDPHSSAVLPPRAP